MNLNKIPDRTLLCIYETGEFMMFMGQKEGLLKLRAENGEQFYLKPADAAHVPCVISTDPQRMQQFQNNVVLCDTYRNALNAAEGKTNNVFESLQEQMAAYDFLAKNQPYLSGIERRIETARTKAPLGHNIASAFLAQLRDEPSNFLGHKVKREGDTLLIDGRAHDLSSGARFLSAAVMGRQTRALEDILLGATHRTSVENPKIQRAKNSGKEYSY